MGSETGIGNTVWRRRASVVWSWAVSVALVTGFASVWEGDTPAARQMSVSRSFGSWAFDVGDDRRLVGSSDNVFFGVVLASEVAPPLVV